jgi:hypothetical protein
MVDCQRRGEHGNIRSAEGDKVDRRVIKASLKILFTEKMVPTCKEVISMLKERVNFVERLKF